MMVNNNLVGRFNPSEKSEFVSWDYDTPNRWRKMFQSVPNHQPEIINNQPRFMLNITNCLDPPKNPFRTQLTYAQMQKKKTDETSKP